jgi:hypothetical protein
VIDADKVAIFEVALEWSLPDRRPLPAPHWPNLCKVLTYGTPFERRHDLANEAIALAEADGDDATTVRVLNHLALPLLVPPLLDQSLDESALSSIWPNASETRFCSSGAPP